MSDAPSWMEEEEGRAEELVVTGNTTNSTAPQLARINKAPERKQKSFFIQPSYAQAFEDLALAQKRLVGSKGKKATELAEEMILDLLEKYSADTSSL